MHLLALYLPFLPLFSPVYSKTDDAAVIDYVTDDPSFLSEQLIRLQRIYNF